MPKFFITLICGIVLFVGGTSAQAATYDFEWGPGPGSGPAAGYENVKGTLVYQSKVKFRYDTDVRDICGAYDTNGNGIGDGYGASFYFLLTMGGGNQIVTPVKGYDTNGCGNGYTSWVGDIERCCPIAKSRVVGCWTNDGELCWGVPTSGGASSWKDNGYV